MYDETTARLIRQTPDLPDLDRQSLPDLLSRYYAEIVAARVRLREADDVSGLGKITHFAMRLAQTNEALVAVAPDRKDRAAAAFVAATAYQLVFQTDQISGRKRPSSELHQQGIAESIAAMLLFMIGDASSDAIEVSKQVVLRNERTVERELVRCLRYLARGQVQEILNRPVLSARAVRGDTDVEIATSALYVTLLSAVRSLAESLLGRSETTDAAELCERVRRLSNASTGAMGAHKPIPVSSFGERAGETGDLFFLRRQRDSLTGRNSRGAISTP